MAEIENFIAQIVYVPDNKSNEMQNYLYFKMNVPKSLPNNVKLLLQMAFTVDEYDISCDERSNHKDAEVISKLYDLLREHLLLKRFDCNDLGGRIEIVCRVFLLAVIRIVGYTYAEL